MIAHLNTWTKFQHLDTETCIKRGMDITQFKLYSNEYPESTASKECSK